MTAVKDVDAAGFAQEVLARSHEVPVVVDFWAEWCGPCRTLGPVLEAAVEARAGAVELVKVDTDANQQLAQQFQIRGIPAVKAFVDGEVVDEFTGALNRAQVDAFLDRVVPTEADRAVDAAEVALGAEDVAGAVAALERALAADPGHREAALALAELLVEDDPARAGELASPHRPDPRAEAVLARAALGDAGDLLELMEVARADPDDDGKLLAYARALAANGHHDEAIDTLLYAVELRGEQLDAVRQQLLDLLLLLGDEDPRVLPARRRLARALF